VRRLRRKLPRSAVAKKARKSPSRAVKAAASKTRAKTGKRSVKKAKKIAKKTVKKIACEEGSKKPSRKPTRKSSQSRPNKPSPAANETSVAEKTLSAGHKRKGWHSEKESRSHRKPVDASGTKILLHHNRDRVPEWRGRTSATPMRRSRPTRSRGFSGSTATTCSFSTGTDEHGLKMIQTAEAEKLPTLEVATRNALRFKEMDQRLNVSFDRFIRTTEQQHHRSSHAIWQRMADNGDIYLDSYAGW